MKLVDEINLKIKVETFCHATEDLNKVIAALNNITGMETKNYRIDKLLGHWRNPIMYVYTEFEKYEALNVLKNIISKMEDNDKKEINSKIHLYLDEQGKLYLRFDKQEAYKGKIILSNKDDIIKVVIHAISRKNKSVIEIYKSLGIINE
jgi:RNA binding exosome subunit